MNESNRALRTGQVAAAAGVNRQTLRYYERRGLLTQPQRSLGGHRLYPPETVVELRMIKAAQRLGFSLAELAELLDSARRHRCGSGGLAARTAAKLEEIEAKIADLATIRDALAEASLAGCDDLLECAASPECPLWTSAG
ncbi:MAG: MerR family transcriptional regulator [Jatrophihabitans sp.]|uniref:MerR family transcriptional regulator n=1 Tax=Jatrophihabitans sp. TaxID=1932789 RepID=UPI00390D1D57